MHEKMIAFLTNSVGLLSIAYHRCCDHKHGIKHYVIENVEIQYTSCQTVWVILKQHELLSVLRVSQSEPERDSVLNDSVWHWMTLISHWTTLCHSERPCLIKHLFQFIVWAIKWKFSTSFPIIKTSYPLVLAWRRKRTNLVHGFSILFLIIMSWSKDKLNLHVRWNAQGSVNSYVLNIGYNEFLKMYQSYSELNHIVHVVISFIFIVYIYTQYQQFVCTNLHQRYLFKHVFF